MANFYAQLRGLEIEIEKVKNAMIVDGFDPRQCAMTFTHIQIGLMALIEVNSREQEKQREQEKLDGFSPGTV